MGDRRETIVIDERRLLGGVQDPFVSAQSITAAGKSSYAVPARLRHRIGRFGFSLASLQRSVEYELDHGMAFLFVPVLLALGTLIYFNLPWEPGFVSLLVPVLISLALLPATVAGGVTRAAIAAILLTFAGMMAAKVETRLADTKVLGSEITIQLTGRVVRIEHQESGRVRLTLDVVSTGRPELRYAPDRVRVTARSIPDGLVPGAGVVGIARLMPPSGPVRPQSYDFAFKRYFDGIGGSGFFMRGPDATELATASTRKERLGTWIESRRGDVAERIVARIGGMEGGIAAALITGIRTGIPEAANEAMRITGLYHVISISGLHMALVGGTIMVSIRTAAAFFPGLATRHPVKKYAAGTALFGTGFYLIVSGGDIAAQRAFLMLAVMLIAVLFDRAALTMRNLAISALIIILVSPHEVIGPSFQMSFAATAALIAAYGAWSARKRDRLEDRGPPPKAGLLRSGLSNATALAMTSIIAGVATALFTAWHFQQISPLGVIANLTAMPLVSIIIMPMAVLATVLMPVGLDGLPLDLMGMGIWGMTTIAFWLAERSAFDATGAIPLSAVLVLTCALVILTMTGGVLRWAAVPLIAAGIALLATRQLPDVLISEDARLVAVSTTSGGIAVNRQRPNRFTIQNWLRAFDVQNFERPLGPEQVVPGQTDGVFVCHEGLCTATSAKGNVIAYAETAEIAEQVCGEAGLIVIADATAENPCRAPSVKVITARDLARGGSAQITWRSEGAAQPHIRYAITEPYRPWHDHRRFSRAARGMGPYVRPERPAPAEPSQAEND
ncbi:ComEC/Rec2 family competence protein [Aliihoeflea sp. PC F10.4]